MIKVIHVKSAGVHKLALAFSDGSEGIYDFSELLARDTLLTRPLRDPAIFQQIFLELGAVCWPNGLEFSGKNLHSTLLQEGKLHQSALTA